MLQSAAVVCCNFVSQMQNSLLVCIEERVCLRMNLKSAIFYGEGGTVVGGFLF